MRFESHSTASTRLFRTSREVDSQLLLTDPPTATRQLCRRAGGKTMAGAGDKAASCAAGTPARALHAWHLHPDAGAVPCQTCCSDGALGGCAGGKQHDLSEHEQLLNTLTRVNTALLNSDDGNAQQESMIVAQAGMLGHITVATNMAGRGTDILLGGDPAQLSLLLLAQPYNEHFIAAHTSANGDGASTGSAESNASNKLQVGPLHRMARPLQS